ncbi:hypothetical protein J4411_03060 [Candidatus Pacearchaeota archaeon]|nr:hypothetical protein [Candidatus Pacearchaeota archaeon]
MNFRFYYEKLVDSEEYKNFIKKNPKAYPCSCLFILDREHSGEGNKVHFDFWLPLEKKMNSFRVDGKVEFMDVENFDSRPFEEISTEHDFNLEDYEEMILNRMGEEGISGKIQKLLFSLQKLKGKEFLITTGFLNNLGLIKVTISVDEKKITNFEKKSFFDMMKIVKGNKNKEEKK